LRSDPGDKDSRTSGRRRGLVERILAWVRIYDARTERIRTPDRAPDYDPATVEALLDEAKFHAAFEESRLNAVQQRASWLLAFDGILIGLAASQSHALLAEARSLGSVGRPLAAISLGIAVILVLISSILALTVIFRAKSWVWSRDEIKNMPSHQSVRSEKAAVQGAFLRGLTNRILTESKAYGYLSRRLNVAFAVLAVGLTSAVISIGVYAVRTVENPCPGASQADSSLEADAQLHKTALFQPTANFVSDDSSPFRCPKGGPGTRTPQ